MAENKTTTAKLGEIMTRGYRYTTTSKMNGGYVFELATFDPPQPSETVFEVAAEGYDHAVNCAHEWALKNHSHSRNSKEYWEEYADANGYLCWPKLNEEIETSAEMYAALEAWSDASTGSASETLLANLLALHVWTENTRDVED